MKNLWESIKSWRGWIKLAVVGGLFAAAFVGMYNILRPKRVVVRDIKTVTVPGRKDKDHVEEYRKKVDRSHRGDSVDDVLRRLEQRCNRTGKR